MLPSIPNFELWAGASLCVAAGARAGVGLARWWTRHRRQTRELALSQAEFDADLGNRHVPTSNEPAVAWKGYRRFVVRRTISEASGITSLELVSEDRRPLSTFHPGQYLTIRVTIPGAAAPLVRCYSLSDRPREDHFRITVKANPEGKVSRFIQKRLHVGDVIEAQAPRGEFFLDEADERPAVLVGGGIGITPLLSMANTILSASRKRKVILLYGVRNSREHAFATYLRELASCEPRLHYLPCYSQPLAEDRVGQDYLAARRVDPDLLRRVLPDGNFPFYVCGPGPFMQDMVAGLNAWGVPEKDIHFEAFGPSTIKRLAPANHPSLVATTSQILFEQSQVTADWQSNSSSILDLAESAGVSIPSGCRAGNCGSCATKLLAGRVKYARKPACSIDADQCLTCIAEPDSDRVVLQA